MVTVEKFTEIPNLGLPRESSQPGTVTIEDLAEMFQDQCKCEARHITNYGLPSAACLVDATWRAKLIRSMVNYDRPVGYEMNVCENWVMQGVNIKIYWSVRPI